MCFVPIRDVAINAVNSIARSPGVAAAAVTALAPALRSGNNGVRIPAIDALVRAVVGHSDATASEVTMDLGLQVSDNTRMFLDQSVTPRLPTQKCPS